MCKPNDKLVYKHEKNERESQNHAEVKGSQKPPQNCCGRARAGPRSLITSAT